MKQEIFEKFLKKLYPDNNIVIIEYDILEKYEINDNNEWVTDTPSVFVTIKSDDTTIIDLTNFLENFTPYEFSIIKI